MRSIRESVYSKIRDDIAFGKYTPGERIIEGKLAKEFESSRSPIREALRQLEFEGLVVFERNKGVTIAKLSIVEVDEIYSLLSLLESYAASISAKVATKKDVVYLRSLNEKLGVAAKNVDLQAWLQNNLLFHNFICKGCGNGNLIQLVGVLRRRVYRYRYLAVSVPPGNFECYLEDHAGILKGCETNDSKMAQKHMSAHWKTIRNILLNYLNEIAPNY